MGYKVIDSGPASDLDGLSEFAPVAAAHFTEYLATRRVSVWDPSPVSMFNADYLRSVGLGGESKPLLGVVGLIQTV